MKKLCLWRAAVVAIVFSAVFIMSSCSNVPDDIKLSDQLVAYAEFGENNDIQWGVKDAYGMVIMPGRYRNFAVEGDVITADGKDDNLKYAFTLKGKFIGKFEMLTHWNENGDYYLGVKYKDRIFYFPKNGDIVSADGVCFGLKHMFLDVDGDVEIRDYNGELIWKIPVKDPIIFKEEGQDAYYIIAPEDWSKAPYPVYDVSGKLLKKMPYEKYYRLLKRASPLKVFERAAINEAQGVLK